VASAVARALGAGRVDHATRLAGTALTLVALLGIGFTAIMLSGGRAIFAALGAEGPALEAALRYSNVFFLGAVPFWLYSAAASILRASGNAAFPAVAGAIGGVVTLAASPLLIFGLGSLPGFGIAGAGAAVVAYNVVMAVVLLRTMWSIHSPTKPSARALQPRWQYAAEILRVSVPSAASTVLTNLTFIVLTGLVAPFGSAATAGYGSGGRLEYLLIPIVFGVGSALVPLVAANDGAGNRDRVRHLVRAGATLGAGTCGVAGGAVALYPAAWMGLFTTDPLVTAVGQAYLVRVGPAYPFLGLGLALYFAAQGRGRTVQPLLAGLTRLLVAGIGSLAVVGLWGGGLDAVFTLMAGGLILYGSVMVFVMRHELGLCANTC
jgi:putative MATE family efflux protein